VPDSVGAFFHNADPKDNKNNVGKKLADKRHDFKTVNTQNVCPSHTKEALAPNIRTCPENMTTPDQFLI
jgi:hypothetical protein